MCCINLQRLELETEISKVKLEKVDLDTHIRAKLASVESQMMAQELERAQEKTQFQEQIVSFKQRLTHVVPCFVRYVCAA